MTRSGLIKRLVAANPQLYARDIERIVGTVFEQIGRERLIAACVEDEVAAWGCGRAARGEPLSEAQHQNRVLPAATVPNVTRAYARRER